jgi:hypothetical protein
MREIDDMFKRGLVPDFVELYETGRLVPVQQGFSVSNPITPETSGFENFTQEQIAEILEIEGF